MKTFTKEWVSAPDNYFQTEKIGLEILKNSNFINAPNVINCSDTKLELEYIDSGSPNSKNAYNFGVNLAKFHNLPVDSWGKTPFGKQFFGPLKNPIIYKSSKFSNFIDYYKHRMQNLIEIYDNGLLRHFNKLDIKSFDIVSKPSYLHGDLWSGNLIWGKNSVYLIDPAPRTGNRFEDLAMLNLFGCSNYNDILKGYNSIYKLPKNFSTHIDFHNLFPILAHAILFRGHYISQYNNMLLNLLEN